MLMESFEAENFRSLKHLKLEKLARVNLLVGKNNSGKTSVLEALYILTRIELADWFEALEYMRGIEETEQDFRSLFYKFDVRNEVRVGASYNGAGRGPSKCRFQLGFPNEQTTRQRRKERKPLLVRIWVGTNKPSHTFAMTRNRDDEMEYNPISDGAETFMEEGLPEKIDSRHSANFLSTTIDLEQLSEQLSELTLNKEGESLIKVMRRIDNRITAFSLDAKGKIHIDLGEGFAMLSSINLMGEGIQRLLSIVAAIASTTGGIVIVDEIDNGLHYSALRILWRGVLEAAREYDVQLFATTHSAEALRHLTWVLDDEEYASYRDDVAAYTLIRADDDTVRSYRYGYSQLEFALEHGVEVRN